MQPQTRKSPRDFFLYAGVIVSLYFTVINFISLAFCLLNIAFPDKLDGYGLFGGGTGLIRFNIASLIVGFPVFLLLSWIVARGLEAYPEKREAFSRKLSAYLTLFLTGATAAIDLVITLNAFLNGEITTRFILKAVVLLVVVGLIFAYYLHDIRRAGGMRGISKSVMWASTVLVLALIVISFAMTGSPVTQRKAAFDEQRSGDFESIQGNINNYYYQNSALPVNLATLQSSGSYIAEITDPETNAPYIYTVTSKTNYELCAKFDLAVATSTSDYVNDIFYVHPAGNKCFDFSAPVISSVGPGRTLVSPAVPIAPEGAAAN